MVFNQCACSCFIHNLQLASLPGKIGALGPNAQPPVVWVQNSGPGLVARQFLEAMTLVQEVLLSLEIAQPLSVLVIKKASFLENCINHVIPSG